MSKDEKVFHVTVHPEPYEYFIMAKNARDARKKARILYNRKPRSLEMYADEWYSSLPPFALVHRVRIPKK